jgi:hypothetical protein
MPTDWGVRGVSQRLLDDLGARFSEIEAPLTALSSMVLVQLLESQKTLLTWCRGTLDDELASHAREERLRELTKTFMASSMELLKGAARAPRRYHEDPVGDPGDLCGGGGRRADAREGEGRGQGAEEGERPDALDVDADLERAHRDHGQTARVRRAEAGRVAVVARIQHRLSVLPVSEDDVGGLHAQAAREQHAERGPPRHEPSPVGGKPEALGTRALLRREDGEAFAPVGVVQRDAPHRHVPWGDGDPARTMAGGMRQGHVAEIIRWPPRSRLLTCESAKPSGRGDRDS